VNEGRWEKSTAGMVEERVHGRKRVGRGQEEGKRLEAGREGRRRKVGMREWRREGAGSIRVWEEEEVGKVVGRLYVKVKWRDGRREEEGRWGRAVRKDLRKLRWREGISVKGEGVREEEGEGLKKGGELEGMEEVGGKQEEEDKGFRNVGRRVGGRKKGRGRGGGLGGCMQIMRHFARISPQNKPGPVFSTVRVM
jgi:hypothetical protein